MSLNELKRSELGVTVSIAAKERDNEFSDGDPREERDAMVRSRVSRGHGWPNTDDVLLFIALSKIQLNEIIVKKIFRNDFHIVHFELVVVVVVFALLHKNRLGSTGIVEGSFVRCLSSIDDQFGNDGCWTAFDARRTEFANDIDLEVSDAQTRSITTVHTVLLDEDYESWRARDDCESVDDQHTSHTDHSRNIPNTCNGCQ